MGACPPLRTPSPEAGPGEPKAAPEDSTGESGPARAARGPAAGKPQSAPRQRRALPGCESSGWASTKCSPIREGVCRECGEGRGRDERGGGCSTAGRKGGRLFNRRRRKGGGFSTAPRELRVR